jgi:hypothetical protein
MRYREPDTELESLVRDTLRFLFVDHAAQVVSSQKLPGIGNGQTFLRAHNTIIRVIRKEGSINVLAAPSHKPNDWQVIEFLLMAADPDCKFPARPVYGSLPELADLLETRMLLLSDALSAERFAVTLQNSRLAARSGLIMMTPPAAHLTAGKRLLKVVLNGSAGAIGFLIPRPKDKYAKTLPVGSDTGLEESVRRELNFVFKNGGRVSSNGRLPIMDFAWVTVDFANLRLRAARDRGSVGVSIAPIHAVRYWYSLGEAVLAVQQEREQPKSVPPSSLRGAGDRIEAEFSKLNEAFSQTQFPATRERLSEIKAILQQAWIEDRNRNHGPKQAG